MKELDQEKPKLHQNDKMIENQNNVDKELKKQEEEKQKIQKQKEDEEAAAKQKQLEAEQFRNNCCRYATILVLVGGSLLYLQKSSN